MVVIYHLLIPILPMGTYPVFGFYVISGYLMTFIMHENYGYETPGRYAFLKNRFLRLYPLFWFASSLSICLIFVLGEEQVQMFHKAISLPNSFGEALQNVSMIYPAWFPNRVTPRLAPPTWALTVELAFYLLICCGLSKTLGRVKIWICVSILYVLLTFYLDLRWENRYFPVAAGSLPFSLGALVYFLPKGKRLCNLGLSSKPLFFLLLLNTLFWIFMYKIDPVISQVGLYINLYLCFGLVYNIANGNEIFSVSKKLDKAVGDYSYPFYLLHWQCGIIASYLFFGEMRRFSLNPRMPLLEAIPVFVSAIVVMLLISYLLNRFVDKPIQGIRKKVKERVTL